MDLGADINVIVQGQGATSSGSLCTVPVTQAQEREIQTGTGAEEGFGNIWESGEPVLRKGDKKRFITLIYWK